MGLRIIWLAARRRGIPGAFVCVIGSLLPGILDRLAGYAKGTVEKTNWSR